MLKNTTGIIFSHGVKTPTGNLPENSHEKHNIMDRAS
jgi:hypothetical protein